MKSSVQRISIVIPSYNSAGTIRACLDSVFSQKSKWKYEVIVVDSGNDEASEIIRKGFPLAILIALKKRTYPGKARNIGIKKAKGKIIACVDSDCIVDSLWLDNLCKAHKKYDVVGGRICNGNPESLVGWSLFFTEFGQFVGSKDKVVANMPTCNISYKKEIFQKYGYFPEDPCAGEDFVFHSKIKEKLFFSGDVIIKHVHRTHLADALKHSYWLGSGAALTRKKHNLPGSFLVKYKFLIPLILFYRFFKIGARAVRSDHFLKFIFSSPFIFGVLISWYLGFFQGALRHTNV